MNIKQYIDYFDEISHLKREQQFTLIEQARNDVNENLKFPIFTVLPYLVYSVLILLLVGGCYFIFGDSGWLLMVSFFLGLVFSRMIIIEINDALMLKAIKKKWG